MSLRTGLKPFIPPILLELWRRIPGRQRVGVGGDYPSWEAASAACTGYDSDEILRRVASATRKVVSGEAVFERDSVLFGEIEYSWPLLSALLQVAAEAGSLRVIDVGGSLGSTWLQNRRFLGRLTLPVAWRVVEQERFVALGRQEFSTRPLEFDYTIAAADEAGTDVILFSSSLCYVPDPIALLRDAAASSARYLIIDRLPLVEGDRDRISVQHVSEPIYVASYPIRLFASDALLSRWLADWRVIETWESQLQPDPNSRCHGFFMEKR